ncbi:MAG TPA: leucyl/phenylalanyl-tRNA--protein transferase [Rudaea sp.]|nr:leucyl/phenylalanyl-tRNA--protein transferase [Rudaea sp.]
MTRIAILRAGSLDPFPPVEKALRDPDGLLAAGGDLSPDRLLDAYRHGVFPWFSPGDPILWWSPDPRTVFDTAKIHISKKLHRELRHCEWTLRADTAFADVMLACAAPRSTQRGTWITQDMFDAYRHLHDLGFAHSIEVYDGDKLVGGIYGVALGKVFFGESMFSRATNGSKIALIALCRMLHANGFPLLDAQVASPHLTTMGAIEVTRRDFVAHVADYAARDGLPGNWKTRWPFSTAKDIA